MKFKALYFIVITCFSYLSFSQQMPIDFSDSNDNFIAFSGSSFSFNTDPTDVTNAVGQFHNNGAIAWQGFYIDLPQAIDLSLEQVISLNFYAFDSNSHNVMVKLEHGSGSNPDVEVVQSTSGSGWSNDLTFNFSNAIISSNGTTTNATGSYSRLVIYIDGGVTSTGTYLIDAISDGSTTTNPHTLDVIYADLVWADEFNTSGAIDTNKWFHQTQLPAGGSWYNGEQQHYTNRTENSFATGGFLNIKAIKENFTDQGVTKQYTSARLNSKFAFTYGRVDVRAKLPFGAGTWPAIWTLGKNINEDGAYWDNEGFGTTGWPVCGEIDIMEHGLGAINHVSSALHTSCAGCFGATMNYQSYALNDVANEFHVYSMNWSPNQITFMIDGVGFYTYNPAVKDNGTWPFDEDQYLLLNVAMGGVAGAIDPAFVESSMVIDYVRVYQNSGLSITEETFANLINISPNPTSDYINIASEKTIDSVQLYNTIGQLILDEKLNTKTLNVKHMKSGIYILKLYSGNLSTTKKVIID